LKLKAGGRARREQDRQHDPSWCGHAHRFA
jgi:hypothetical protein